MPARPDPLVLLFCSHNHTLRSILTSFHFLQTPVISLFDPCVLLGFFSVSTICITNTFTFGSPSSILPSQSPIEINPNLFRFLSCRIPSPLNWIPVSRSPSSRCLFFRHYITNSRTLGPPLSAQWLSQSLIDSNPNLAPFLQTPIFIPFGLRLLLVFVSVSCSSCFASPINARLVLHCLHFALKTENGDQF